MAQEQSAGRLVHRAGFVGSRRYKPSTFLPVIAFALLMTGTIAAIFLAGKEEQGNLGMFLLFAGAAMLMCPPRVGINRSVGLAAVAFLVCNAAALLPAHFFHVPMWRQALAGVPDLPLPGTVSAAPRQTVFWVVVLALTALTGMFVLTQPIRSRDLLAFAMAAAGMCGAYSALSIFAKLSGWVYPFAGEASFGFFPNRNHTATLLITGSVLSVAVLAVAFREQRWLLADGAAAALAPCVTGLLFFSESRAGVVFLLLGIGIWLVGLGRGHRNRPLLLTVLLATLLGGGLFLALRGGVRDRLLRSLPGWKVNQQTASPGAGDRAVRQSGGRWSSDLSADDRLRIYRDTWAMVRDFPLTGTGLGTFALVFPPYRQTSANVNLVLHPESDWLMVAAETGLPALGCLGLVGFFVWKSWRPEREHPSWPLRWGFLAAAGAAFLHALVDVPLHRAALGWWVLLLVGLALQPGRASVAEGRAARPAVGRVARGTFIVGGLLALGLGTRLVWAQWFGGSALPPYEAQQAQAEILRTFERGDNDGALEQARHAVQVSPLFPPIYYQLGVLALRNEDTDAEVDRAFHMQRLLNPVPPDVPRLQGMAWLPVDPARTAALFVESLERQKQLIQEGNSMHPASSFWRELVDQAKSGAQTQRLLWNPAVAQGPGFVVAWLEGANPDVANERLPGLAMNPRFLEQLNPGERRRFLAAWQNKGDKNGLQTFIKTKAASWVEAEEFRTRG